MLTCAHVVRVASARCQVMPSDTASAAWSAQMSAGIPWSLRGPCRVLGAIVPVVFGYACVVRPFPTWVHGVPGFPHRAPKVVGIHPRYGVSRPALVRSECGCVLWWSVPVGPTWVRVQPPHVPKRGDAPTRCSCEPRLHPLRRSSVTPWYRQVGVYHRCRPDRRPAGTRLRGSGALGMPTPRREDALVPRRCPPQRKYTICRDGVRQRCRDSCCVCCVRARATYRCADADGAYVCGASRVLSIGGVSRGPPVAGYDSSDR